MRNVSILGACMLLLLPVGLVAQEQAGEATEELTGEDWPIEWGQHIEGPTVSPVDLPGRVLLLAMWDEDYYNVEWIRRLGKIRKRHGDKLLIIASHSFDSDHQAMLDTWSMVEGGELITLMQDTHVSREVRVGRFKKKGPRTGLRSGYHSSIYDRACVLFDHRGELIAQDDVETVERLLPEACKQAPGHLAYGREWVQFADEAELLGAAERNMSRALATLRKTMQGGDLVAIEEAQALLDRVTTWSEREMAEIERLRTVDATACMLRLSRMVAWLKGDPLGEPFQDLLKTLKDDKVFASTLKAEAMIRSMREDARLMNLADEPDAAKRNKSYFKRMRRIGNTCRGIIEALPDSTAAALAQQMLLAYRL